MADAREVWITGIGIVSCLGEGIEAHWQGLSEPSSADTTAFAPYVVHRAVPVDFDKQIPKKGDQRQMEAWQRYGVYAAGLALDSAGMKGNADLLAQIDMIVAAGGGERDGKVDISVLAGLRTANDRGAYLNQRLMSDLRPTLFLAQLSNLMAGNISIVHGVTGSSRTFMGEEPAGVDAMRIALARITGRTERDRARRRRLQCRALRRHSVLRPGEMPHPRPAHAACGSALRSVAAWSLAPSRRFWCSRKSSTRSSAAPSRLRG